MSIDPTLLRPFLGELDAARAHLQSLRSTIDSIGAPNADADELLFSARMDADFATGSLRAAPRHAAPRDAARGAFDLADHSGERLSTALAGLEDTIRAAGGQTDAAAVVDRVADVRRATERLLRWDLDELARVARDGGSAGLGVADELGHWTSFEVLAARELSAAAGVVRDDTDDLMRQLDDLGQDVGPDDAPDDVLDALDVEIAVREAARKLEEVATPAHFGTAASRAGRSLEARAADAMDTTTPDVHLGGRAPSLAQVDGGLIVSGSDDLLDAIPADGDVVATSVLRGPGETVAELPLISTGRSLRFPNQSSALSTLERDYHGSWVLSPDRAGGWRALEVESASGEAADAMLEAMRIGNLQATALRGEVAAVRGFIVQGMPKGLRRDAPEAARLPAPDPVDLQATIRVGLPGTLGLPRSGTPLVAVDVTSGLRRRAVTVDLATGSQLGRVVDATRVEALRALRREALHSGDHATVLMKLGTGRYAIVEANGASATQLQRALAPDRGAPRVLDPRVEAMVVTSGRRITAGVDLVTGARIAS